MISFILYFLFGFADISVPCEMGGVAADILLRSRFRFNMIESKSDMRFRIALYHFFRLTLLFDGEGVPYSVIRRSGLPTALKKYRTRWGIFVGILLFCVTVFLSGRYVWYIDVTGNKTVSKEDIIENLEAVGFSLGTKISSCDISVLTNAYLAKFDDLCWISVNMEGTWAHVEVRELKDFEKKEDERTANVVASEPGQIVIVETYEGKPMVKAGDFVGKGDLIISGVMTVGDDGIRFESSSGRVLAKVERNFDVEIPKIKEIDVPTGAKIVKKGLVFFKKQIKLSGNSGIPYRNYATISEKRQVFLFGSFPLPLFVLTDTYSEYSKETVSLSDSEVMSEVKSEFSRELNCVLDGAELLSLDISDEDTEECYVRHVRISCLADIAEVRYFETDRSLQGGG